MGKWNELKQEFAEEKKKEEEKRQAKQDKKAEWSQTDKVVTEAYGIAKILFIGKYAFSIIFGLLFFIFVGWFILDMVWSWFTGLF